MGASKWAHLIFNNYIKKLLKYTLLVGQVNYFY